MDQLTKSSVLSEIQNYWFLLLAVLIGGQIGNFLNLKIFPTRISGFSYSWTCFVCCNQDGLQTIYIIVYDKDFFKK